MLVKCMSRVNNTLSSFLASCITSASVIPLKLASLISKTSCPLDRMSCNVEGKIFSSAKNLSISRHSKGFHDFGSLTYPGRVLDTGLDVFKSKMRIQGKDVIKRMTF